MRSIILALHKQLSSKAITIDDLINVSKKIAHENKDLNTILTPIYNTTTPTFNEKKLLSGIPYSLKDNVSTKNILTTGGSLFLSNYLPPFSATVYDILQKEGAILVSKDNMDEFGLGGTGIHSAYGYVLNPYDKTRIPGGSSSGSAVNVSIGVSAFAIGTDTGDSVRRPAALCGIVGFKPTYGAISRYGILPYAPSLDHVGILTKYVADATIVASYIIKQDSKDINSTNLINDVKFDHLKTLPNIKFVVIKNFLPMLDEVYRNKFIDLLDKLSKKGHTIIYADFNHDLLKSIMLVYRVISYVEGYSCYSNLSGIVFGKNLATTDEDYEMMLMKNRTECFGTEIKRRFVMGSYLSDAYNFESCTRIARQLRHLLNDEELKLLKMGDCILMPTVHKIAPFISDPYSSNVYDDWLMLANLSGTPSITVPFTKINNMPWGITLNCDVYQDMKLLNIAYTLEEFIGGEYE